MLLYQMFRFNNLLLHYSVVYCPCKHIRKVLMAFDFSGKRFLVTGAGRGIGREVCIALVKAGGEVYGLSRQKAGLDSLIAEYPSIKPICVDLSDWEATRKEAEKLPVLDGLVNNAGVSYPWEPSVSVDRTTVDNTMNINLMAPLNLIQVCGKKMIDSGKGGSIVNVSSITGILSMKESMAYNLSKAALDMMTRQFALEFGPNNIRVNSVNPTVVYTDMGKEFWCPGQEKTDRLIFQTPMGRFAEVQEVVGPIMFLLSDLSTMITGTLNPIEGGFLSSISL